MYANGEGVPEDHAEAVRWFRLAAEQGDAEAQYNLGLMYAKSRRGVAEPVLKKPRRSPVGVSVQRDISEARRSPDLASARIAIALG